MPKRRSSTRKRVRADWVYRSADFDVSTSTNQWELASYAAGVYKTFAAGSSDMCILYDSQNYLNANAGNGVDQFILNRSARAEGRKARTLAVSGYMAFQASTWTLGSEIRMAMRIGVFEQNADDGSIAVIPDYNMLNGAVASNADTAAVFANDRRGNLWEHYHFMHFATGNEQSLRVLRVRTAAKAYLAPNECLAMYMENQAGSVGLRYWTALRTLVADEG